MKLTEPIIDELEYNGGILVLDMSFDNVLRLYELLNDDYASNEAKVVYGLRLLVDNYDFIEDEDMLMKYELFKFIMEKFVGDSIEEKQEESPEKGKGKQSESDNVSKKSFDFEVDAERIFASFMMDYKIDLIHLQGKLHWKKFIALFNGLSDDSPFKKVVNIREMKVPAPNKYNTDERAEIIRLKERYKLDNDIKDKINSLSTAFGALKEKAKIKNTEEKDGDKQNR